MLSDRICLLARDLEAASELRELVAQCHPFHEILTLDSADPAKRQDFLLSLGSAKPDLVFVEVRTFQDLAEVLEPAVRADPMLPLVVYGRKIDNHTYLELHRLGFGNRILHLPAKREALDRVLANMRSTRVGPPPLAAELCPVVSFLPGKPGSGASTAAWHFANFTAQRLGRHVALVDLDLNCGVQAIFGSVLSSMSLFDVISVVDHTGRLPDREYLPSRGGVDILSTNRRCRSSRIDSRLFDNFLAAVRAAYPLVIVDHSGNWERFSVQALQLSSLVFCVSANDYLSLAQTYRVVSLMEEEGVRGSVSLLLNRHGSRFGVPLEEAERLSGLQVAASLPNCFAHLQQSVLRNCLVDPGSPYAASMARLAAETLRSLKLFDSPEPAPIPQWEDSRGWRAIFRLQRPRNASMLAQGHPRS
jgi:MinD-like ATPase involved in chromosome partitioning or flagellar assembly